jgi:hypothetical protein
MKVTGPVPRAAVTVRRSSSGPPTPARAITSTSKSPDGPRLALVLNAPSLPVVVQHLQPELLAPLAERPRHGRPRVEVHPRGAAARVAVAVEVVAAVVEVDGAVGDGRDERVARDEDRERRDQHPAGTVAHRKTVSAPPGRVN